MMNRPIAAILAHVLASTALAACGGKALEVVSDDGGDPTIPTSADGGKDAGRKNPQPPDPRPDASWFDARVDAEPWFDAGFDAGVECAPIRVRENNSCGPEVWYSPCGIPDGVVLEDGLSGDECKLLCGGGERFFTCSEYQEDDLPGPSFNCYSCIEGRRPQGYAETPLIPTIAGWLAHAADLERVSIDAFQIMRRELLHHGAPGSLIEATLTAEQDEIRHARVLGALARREGATVSREPIRAEGVRSLVDIAIENAVEGCIRETFGALVAGWQSEHATRLNIRRAMKRIYKDETSHADLAWRAHAWMMEQLSCEDRIRVEAAMMTAMAELAESAKASWPADVRTNLGLPAPLEASEMVARLREDLWNTALAA